MAVRPNLILCIGILALSGCTSTTVNEHREQESALSVATGEKLVILGRRHAGHYETEPEFIRCIGDELRDSTLKVIDEREFVDLLYPWFEPRTAPLNLKRLQYMLKEPLLARRIAETGLRYMVWVDGNTETKDKQGSVSCAIGPGGGGCFGFATWDKDATYEAIVWDIDDFGDEGRVKVEANGTSYMLAVGAPIPFIARVQAEACEGIGDQLSGFFQNPDNPPPEK
jgi:hypothetical protein